MAMLPHSPLICLQQARSAGLKCAFGSAHAIAGATSGSTTASINAKWRKTFMTASTLHRDFEEYKRSMTGSAKRRFQGGHKQSFTSSLPTIFTISRDRPPNLPAKWGDRLQSRAVSGARKFSLPVALASSAFDECQSCAPGTRCRGQMRQ
jgi:hypothetical protein